MQTQSNVVIGQIVPYLGEYGISKNPESFATYGFQKYFADANRGIIGRLSRDGITEISNYGMKDYFRDSLSVINPFSSLVTTPYNIILPLTLPNIINNIILSPEVCDCCSIKPGMLLRMGTIDVNPPVYVIDVRESGEGCSVTFSDYINWVDYGLTAWRVSFNLLQYFSDKLVGGWDINNACYTVSLQPTTVQNGCVTEVGYSTLNFDESINGWVSFYDYKPEIMFSLKNSFLSSDGFKLWRHYYDNPTSRGNFYDQGYKPSQIRFVFNPSISIVKSFQTISYEGSNGWEVMRYYSDPTEFNQDPHPITIPTDPLTFTPGWKAYTDKAQQVLSYEEGVYTDPADGLVYRVGFERKENRYVSELKSASLVQAGEVVYWDGILDSNGIPTSAAPTSGLKGYYVTVDLQTDNATDVGGLKELFAVSSNWVVSST